MPRRNVLTAAQRDQLLAFPDDEAELIRLFTLSRADLAYVRAHRGDQNRLGVAVQMSYLRFPGRTLVADETPFAPLLGIVAAQLGISTAVWTLYATRDETRREHATELFARLGLEPFSRPHFRAMLAWLAPLAMQTTQGVVLATAAVEELRLRRIVLPALRVLESLCAEATTRAQRKVHQLLTAPLSAEQRTSLDALLLTAPENRSVCSRGSDNRQVNRVPAACSPTLLD